jgi:hypothetical protein
MIFNETPRLFRLAMVSTILGFGRIEQDEESHKRHAGFVGFAHLRSGPHVLAAPRRACESPSAELLQELL